MITNLRRVLLGLPNSDGTTLVPSTTADTIIQQRQYVGEERKKGEEENVDLRLMRRTTGEEISSDRSGAPSPVTVRYVGHNSNPSGSADASDTERDQLQTSEFENNPIIFGDMKLGTEQSDDDDEDDSTTDNDFLVYDESSDERLDSLDESSDDDNSDDSSDDNSDESSDESSGDNSDDNSDEETQISVPALLEQLKECLKTSKIQSNYTNVLQRLTDRLISYNRLLREKTKVRPRRELKELKESKDAGAGQELQSLRNQLIAAERKKETLDKELKDAHKAINGVFDNLYAATKSEKSLKQQLKSLREQLIAAQKETNELEQQLKDAKATCEERTQTAKSEHDRLKKQMETLQREHESNVAQMRKETKTAQTNVAASETKSQKEKTALKAKLKKAHDEVLAAERNAFEQERGTLAQQLEEAKTKLAKCEAAKEFLRETPSDVFEEEKEDAESRDWGCVLKKRINKGRVGCRKIRGTTNIDKGCMMIERGGKEQCALLKKKK